MKRWFVLLCFLCMGCSTPTTQPEGETSAETVQDTTSTPDEGTQSKEQVQEGTTQEQPGDGGTTEPPVPEQKVEPVVETKPEPVAEVPEEKPQESAPDGGQEPVQESTPDGGQELTPEDQETTPEATTEQTPDIAGLTCQERATKAADYVETERKKHLSCTANTECTSITPATDCQGACPLAVNSTGQANVTAAIAQVNQTYCKNYQGDGCPYATPKCVNRKPFCDEGQCELYDCNERRKRAAEAVENVRKQNLSCFADSDCTVFFSGTNCAGACQAAVNQTGEVLVKAAIDQVNKTLCADYQKDGCPFATPSCLPATAKCVNNECVVAP